MKARLIQPARAVNPEYSEDAKQAAKAEGETYDVPVYIELPVGFEMDDPQCWVHCVPGHLAAAPIAEAIDDECRSRVKQWMEVERPKQLAQIQQMLQPETFRKLKKDTQGWVTELAETYEITADGPLPGVSVEDEGDNDEVSESGDAAET